MKYISLLGLFVTLAQASGADPTTPKISNSAKPEIRFPTFVPPAPPKVVVPPPIDKTTEVDPAAPAKLGKGQYYVIASNKPLLVLSHGTGKVDVTLRKPPFMLPASQAIGWPPDPKDPEFVTWGAEYPFIYLVKPAKSGDVNLQVSPAVTKINEMTKEQIPITEADVVYKPIQVDDGTGPRPPPDVDPKVDPKVDTIPTPVGGFRVLFVYQDPLKGEQLHIMNSTKIVAWLNENCTKDDDSRPSWRKWPVTIDDRDPDLKFETALWKQLWKDAKPKLGTLPQIVVVNGQTGQVYAWPETEQAMLDFLKDKKGGK